MFTKADWEFVPGDLRTKLILQEMRKQLRERKNAEENNLKKYTEEELFDNVKEWSLNRYRVIREYQQGLDQTPIHGIWSDMIEQYISLNQNYEGPVYRGINVDAETARGFQIGQVIDQGGTSSWSSQVDKAADFADQGSKESVIMVSSPKRGCSIKVLSEYEDENEVVISRDTRWAVTQVTEESGIIYVFCEEVG